MDFVIPADHMVKTKRLTNTLTLLENRKLWNMRLTIKPNLVGALGMVPKGFGKKKLEELEIRRRIKTTQTISLLRPARIHRKVLET